MIRNLIGKICSPRFVFKAARFVLSAYLGTKGVPPKITEGAIDKIVDELLGSHEEDVQRTT